jgi:hypothetical protein
MKEVIHLEAEINSIEDHKFASVKVLTVLFEIAKARGFDPNECVHFLLSATYMATYAELRRPIGGSPDQEAKLRAVELLKGIVGEELEKFTRLLIQDPTAP